MQGFTQFFVSISLVIQSLVGGFFHAPNTGPSVSIPPPPPMQIQQRFQTNSQTASNSADIKSTITTNICNCPANPPPEPACPAGMISKPLPYPCACGKTECVGEPSPIIPNTESRSNVLTIKSSATQSLHEITFSYPFDLFQNYVIEYGDGTSEKYQITSYDPCGPDCSPTDFSHSYAAAATYVVQIKDQKGNTITSLQVKVK